MVHKLFLILASLTLLTAQERSPVKPQVMPSESVQRLNEGISSQKEAIKEAQRQIDLAPDSAAAYFNLGEAYRNADGNAQAAAEAYKRALVLKPEYAEAYLGLAWAYRVLNQNERQVEALEHAVQLNAHDAEAQRRLGDAYSTFDSREPVTPSASSEQVNLTVEVRKKRAKLAVEAYERALLIKPDFVEAYLGLGSAYVILQRHSEAIEAYKRAIGYDPDNPLTHIGLGYVYLASSDYEAASEQPQDCYSLNREC